MSFRIIILFFSFFVGLIHWACVKGNPVAADQNAAPTATPVYTYTATATATPTPLGSTITVNVIDGVAQSGVTVIANPPYGAATTLVTNSSGIGVFGIPISGSWILNVPTQGNFYQSSVTVNATASGSTAAAVTFTTQGQSLGLSATGGESYSITGGNIGYNITYSQLGNLMEPIILSTSGSLNSTGWTINFSPVTIGNPNTMSQLNIVIPSSASTSPNFQIVAKRLDGSTVLTSNLHSITKNYAVQTNLNITNAYSILSGPATVSGFENGGTNFLVGSLNLSTLNAGDSTTSWTGSLSLSSSQMTSGGGSPSYANYLQSFYLGSKVASSGSTIIFSMNSGTSQPVTFFVDSTDASLWNLCGDPQTMVINVSLTSADGNVNGGVTFNSSNPCISTPCGVSASYQLTN